MNETETPVAVSEGGKPVYVEEGPAWLVKLLVDPQGWILAALLVGVLLLLGAVWWRSRDVDVELEATREEILENLSILVVVGWLAAELSSLEATGYLVDVGVALAVGYPLAVFVVASLLEELVERLVERDEAQDSNPR